MQVCRILLRDPFSRQEHQQRTRSFICGHPDLFEDGDVFCSCQECENGAGGDPRGTGDVAGLRRFLIDEDVAAREAFARIGKKNVTIKAAASPAPLHGPSTTHRSSRYALYCHMPLLYGIPKAPQVTESSVDK